MKCPRCGSPRPERIEPTGIQLGGPMPLILYQCDPPRCDNTRSIRITEASADLVDRAYEVELERMRRAGAA